MLSDLRRQQATSQLGLGRCRYSCVAVGLVPAARGLRSSIGTAPGPMGFVLKTGDPCLGFDLFLVSVLLVAPCVAVGLAPAASHLATGPGKVTILSALLSDLRRQRGLRSSIVIGPGTKKTSLRAFHWKLSQRQGTSTHGC